MRLKESSKIEFKESTAELKQALEDICAFANNGEGVLYFGITDDGNVKGQEISDKTIQRVSTSILSSIEPRVYPNICEETMNGKSILVVEVKNGPDKPYFYKGKSYKRVGTSNAYLSRYEVEKALYERDNPKYRYEKTPIKDYKGRLDRKTINWFLKKAQEERNHPINKSDKQDILSKFNLTTQGELNLAGLLCFGKDIQKYIPQAVVKCGIFEGTTKAGGPKLGSEIYKANIFEQIESVQQFFMKNFRKRYEVDPATGRREYEYEWPLLAIREAVANAVAHRDYMISSTISVAVFDDRVEIWSPGALPDGMTIKKLTKKHESVLRNPAIAEMLYLTKYVETWGTGIDTMNTLIQEAGLPEPMYEEIGSFFVVTFKKAEKKESGMLNEGLNEGLKTAQKAIQKTVQKTTQKQQEILSYLEHHPGSGRKELAENIKGITESGIKYNLKVLQEKGLLKRVGPDKGGHWEVLIDDKDKR